MVHGSCGCVLLLGALAAELLGRTRLLLVLLVLTVRLALQSRCIAASLLRTSGPTAPAPAPATEATTAISELAAVAVTLALTVEASGFAAALSRKPWLAPIRARATFEVALAIRLAIAACVEHFSLIGMVAALRVVSSAFFALFAVRRPRRKTIGGQSCTGIRAGRALVTVFALTIAATPATPRVTAAIFRSAPILARVRIRAFNARAALILAPALALGRCGIDGARQRSRSRRRSGG